MAPRSARPSAPSGRVIIIHISLILAALATGCLGSGADDAEPPALASRTFQLEGGGWAEANLRMAPGDAVTMTFSADGSPVAWDAHTHRDGQVRILEQGNGTRGEATITADAAGAYSFYWQVPDDAPPLTLTIELKGHATVDGWHPY